MAPHPADINGFVSGFDDRFYERSVMGWARGWDMNFREGARRLELVLFVLWTLFWAFFIIIKWVDSDEIPPVELWLNVLAVWFGTIVAVDILVAVIAWVWNGFFGRWIATEPHPYRPSNRESLARPAYEQPCLGLHAKKTTKLKKARSLHRRHHHD